MKCTMNKSCLLAFSALVAVGLTGTANAATPTCAPALAGHALKGAPVIKDTTIICNYDGKVKATEAAAAGLKVNGTTATSSATVPVTTNYTIISNVAIEPVVKTFEETHNGCVANFLGLPYSKNYPRPEEKGVTLCEYGPGAVTDAQTKAGGALLTAGDHGTWAQKYNDKHTVLFSAARKPDATTNAKEAVKTFEESHNGCVATFLGLPYSKNYPRPEEKGVTLCEYGPGTVTDAQTKAGGALLTAGSHGTWAQKYNDKHTILFSAARKPDATTTKAAVKTFEETHNGCSATYLGKPYASSHARVEEKGVFVCDYSGSVSDAACVAPNLKTAGANGVWCQAYNAKHTVLNSVARITSAPTVIKATPTTPTVTPGAQLVKVTAGSGGGAGLNDANADYTIGGQKATATHTPNR